MTTTVNQHIISNMAYGHHYGIYRTKNLDKRDKERATTFLEMICSKL